VLGSLAVEEVGADDVWGGDIYQVPAVHVRRVLKIEIIDALPLLFVGPTISPNEDDQRRQALLVYGAVQQLGDILQVKACVALRNDTHRRNSHTKKDVPLAVPTRARLEEPLELRHALRFGGLAQFAAQLV